MRTAFLSLFVASALMAAERAPFTAPLPPPQYDDVESSSIYLTMHDGVRIAVDVVLPKELHAKIPALYRIARFGRAPLNGNIAAEDRFWARHGYARILIDERGTGASFGVSGYGAAEVGDLREITDWVVKQPWSNGRVGAIGISVEGTAAELLAATGHPAVRAVAPLFSDYNFYTDLVRPGGVYYEWLMKGFGAFVKEMDAGGAAKRVDADTDGSLLRHAIAEHAKNADLYESTHNADFIDDPLPGAGRSLLDISIKPLAGALKKAHVPMLIFVSWFDAGTVRGTLARYRDDDNVQRIFIGAWSHGAGFTSNPFLPDVTAADPTERQQLAEQLAFFDRWLKDGHDEASARRGIHYFTIGTNQWQSTRTWPPPGVHKFVYHPACDATLKTTDAAQQCPVHLTDTSSGDASRWRTQFGGQRVSYEGVLPQMEKLTSFTTESLAKPLEITGQPILRVRLACAAGDPSLFAYLVAIDPDGKPHYLTEGQLRLIDRKLTFRRNEAQPVPNGRPISATLTMMPISAVVPARWRVQLLLASGDTPSFRTTGSFDATIFTSSTLELPVVR